MELAFEGEIWEWRGPAPYHFVWVPREHAVTLGSVAAVVSYGWGMIPVGASIGATSWTTSLWPKEGRYVVPIKDAVRIAENLRLGQVVEVRLTVET